MGPTFVTNIHPSFRQVQERKAMMARLMQSVERAKKPDPAALLADVTALLARLNRITGKTGASAPAAGSFLNRYRLPSADNAAPSLTRSRGGFLLPGGDD